MGGQFTQARKIAGWATTVYLAPNPAVAQGRLYNELSEMLLSVAYGSKRMFVALPLKTHELSFRQSLVELISELNVNEKVLDPFEEDSKLPIVISHWQIDEQDAALADDGQMASGDNSLPVNLGKPLRVTSYDGSYYISERIARGSAFEDMRLAFVNSIVACSELSTDLVLNQPHLITLSEGSDIFLLKPSLFGVGIDLNALFRRIIGTA